MEKTPKTKAGAVFAFLLLAAGIAGLVLVLALSFSAVKAMSGGYRALRDADLSGGYSGSFFYDDRLYVTVGYGVEVDAADPDAAGTMGDFLAGSLRLIFERILFAGVLYTLVVCAALSLWLRRCWGGRAVRHALACLAATAGVYLVFLGGILAAFAVFRLPVPVPSDRALAFLCASLLSMLGGVCALGVLLRMLRRPTPAAVLCVPLALVLFLAGFLFENGLFSDPFTDSFGYAYQEIEEEAAELAFYDAERNVLVSDGKEYPPEQIPNPDHYSGAGRAGAALFEILMPGAGGSLGLAWTAGEFSVPGWALVLYSFKGILWTAAAAVLPRGRRQKESGAS